MMTLFLMLWVLGVATIGKSQEPHVTLSRQLLRNTVQLLMENASGGESGTGFFYDFSDGTTNNVSCFAIVTCWHVVKGATAGKVVISLLTNLPDGSDRITVILGPENTWLRHPDTNVDLAILPVWPILNQTFGVHRPLNVKFLRDNQAATKDDFKSIGATQEIKFVGYPIGISDVSNNLPVIRGGMIASDPSVDYNGETKFLIDAAVVPGSSGSPVFIVDEGIYAGGMIQKTPELKLIGIISDAFYRLQNGKVQVLPIPSDYRIAVETPIPINLGVAIKSDRLKDFVPVMLKMQSESLKTNSPAK